MVDPTAKNTIEPLFSTNKIVNPDGTPTQYFIRWAQERSQSISDGITYADLIALLASININAGVGLDGGGPINADVTLDLADTAVTPATYGDATHSPQITVDQQGRITAAVDVPISGGGGGGGGLTLIAQVTTALSQPTVVFNTLPNTYKHLLLVAHMGSEENNGGNTENCIMQFNGDTTGANYSTTGQGLFGAVAGFASAGGMLVPSCNTTGVPFGQFTTEIIDYLDTTQYQSWNAKSTAWQQNVGILSAVGGGMWTGTAAITDILLKPTGAQNWKDGSQFWLYGIS